MITMVSLHLKKKNMQDVPKRDIFGCAASDPQDVDLARLPVWSGWIAMRK